jgi:hypothetical protein
MPNNALQVRMHFRPEFINRIDEFIVFQGLRLEQIKSIVLLQVGRGARGLGGWMGACMLAGWLACWLAGSAQGRGGEQAAGTAGSVQGWVCGEAAAAVSLRRQHHGHAAWAPDSSPSSSPFRPLPEGQARGEAPG